MRLKNQNHPLFVALLSLILFFVFYPSFVFPQQEIPVFGFCKGDNLLELEKCSNENLIRHLSRKMKLQRVDYISLGIENTLPIVMRFTITAEGEYENLKVYDTQWRIDLQWLTRDAKKKWNKGLKSHEYIVVAMYRFSAKQSFEIEIAEDEDFIQKALARAQAEDDFNLGTNLMNNGDYQKAIERFTHHLSFYPTNTNAIYNMALCYDRSGDSIQSCLYWKYLADKGDMECKQLVRNYCRFDYSSPEVLKDVDVKFDPVVTVYPEFPGGSSKLESFISENLIIPRQAKKNKVTGLVTVTFIVAKSGILKDVKVIKGLGHGCDVEAIRIVESMPNWTPGKRKGEVADILVTLPIFFDW